MVILTGTLSAEVPEMHANSGLILTRNIVPACQIRSLIEGDAKAADLVLSDLDAYTCLNHQRYHFLICDIDDTDVQGMAVAEWFRDRFRGAPWYAICRHGNSRNMRLAREHGADGYFFLNNAGLALDPQTGMTRTLLRQRRQQVKPAMHRPAIATELRPGY
jgi:CheY-like chemotaxis protein